MHSKSKPWIAKPLERFAALAIAVLAAMIWMAEPAAALTPVPPPPITEVYYYDTVTGELYKGPVKEFPPIATPKGSLDGQGLPAGVKANVFSCGKCEASEWYIGYLETYTPEAREAEIRLHEELEKVQTQPATQPGPGMPPMGPTPEQMMTIAQGHLVAEVKAPLQWAQQESAPGAQLVNAANKKCGGQAYPQQCFPGRPDWGGYPRVWMFRDFVIIGGVLFGLIGVGILIWAVSEQKAQKKGFRGWINRNSVVMTIVSVLLLFMALTYCIW
jgi:hypothetical protein